ncbi:MAG: hypothetical protein ACR65O_13740 [Methylomicrobium sp.]
MGTILKNSCLMILIITMETPAAIADSFQDRDRLLLFSSVVKAMPEELDIARGREGITDITLNLQNAQAIIKNSQATNNINGSNWIDGSSFANASGITSVIQNTGNNVIIQDATIISVTIAP